MDEKIPQIEAIRLGDIFEPESPLRGIIDMETIRELAESIREKGLLQPILVRPRAEKFEIVFGHRRYLAHKLLGADMIMAEVRDIPDEECLLLRAIENLQREDLSPMEEANVYGMLRNKLNYTVEDIARKMGKNRITIRKYLRLLDLPENFQKYVDSRVLAISVATVLAEIDDEVLRNYYLLSAAENGCSLKTAELWVSDYQATKAARYYQVGMGVDGPEVHLPPKPIFHACEQCLQPVELNQLKHLIVCPVCWKEIQRRRLDAA